MSNQIMWKLAIFLISISLGLHLLDNTVNGVSSLQKYIYIQSGLFKLSFKGSLLDGVNFEVEMFLLATPMGSMKRLQNKTISIIFFWSHLSMCAIFGGREIQLWKFLRVRGARFFIYTWIVLVRFHSYSLTLCTLARICHMCVEAMCRTWEFFTQCFRTWIKFNSFYARSTWAPAPLCSKELRNDIINNFWFTIGLISHWNDFLRACRARSQWGSGERIWWFRHANRVQWPIEWSVICDLCDCSLPFYQQRRAILTVNNGFFLCFDFQVAWIS